MKLKISVPQYCINEVEWVVKVLFYESLGLEYELIEHDQECFYVEYEGKFLKLADVFFNQASRAWLKNSSLPTMPLQTWDAKKTELNILILDELIPVIYGIPEVEISESSIRVGIDIIGSSFFMLSRYEELVLKTEDKHERFPASASVAYMAGFLERPIINEYIEILWASISHLWPKLERKKRSFRNLVTCDVDYPFDTATKSFFKTFLRVGARVIRDRNYRLAVKDFLNYFLSPFGNYIFDDYFNNLKWIMDVNEKKGNKVAFYFIPQVTSEKFDCHSSIVQPRVRKLIKDISNRGHEIGFHPGYMTYKSERYFNASSNLLRNVLSEEKVSQSRIGGRQHYLRWDASQTPMLWDKANFDYDSTLSYADKVGFRCGICYEYTMYDLTNRKSLKLKQRPLVLMEVTVVSQEYEGLGYTAEALNRCLHFKKIVKKYSGDFVLLWHNTSFTGVDSKSIYQELL